MKTGSHESADTQTDLDLPLSQQHVDVQPVGADIAEVLTATIDERDRYTAIHGDHVIISDNPGGFLTFILSVSRSLYKKNRAKMLLMTLASLGPAAFLCTTGYGQCKVEKGEFYVLGADPVTLYYDAEFRDVAKSKAIENFDEKSSDDSNYYFPNPTVCGEGKGRVLRWPLPNSHLSVYFPFSKLGVTLGLYARRRAEEDLRAKEREKRTVTYALLRRDEQKSLNDDIRRLKRVLARH